MKNEQIIECIKRAASAYRALESARSECEDAVDAEIDFLVADCSEPITQTDKKNIKKIAKAIASSKVTAMANEAKSLAEMLVALMETVVALTETGETGDDEGAE